MICAFFSHNNSKEKRGNHYHLFYVTHLVMAMASIRAGRWTTRLSLVFCILAGAAARHVCDIAKNTQLKKGE